MRVTWLNTDPQIASARFRSLIPGQILLDRGLVTRGPDVVVAAKHGWDARAVRASFPRMVMDVCDDHFAGPLGDHYRRAVELADVVTCNSKQMALHIKWWTGRQAVVIDDPYEDEERPPTSGDGVLWFGHKSNLKDLEAASDQVHHPLTIISNHNWHAQALHDALIACRCVVIPTGKSMAKSANRAVKAIRYGKFPVCGTLPAHEELGLGTTDLGGSLDACMSKDMGDEVRELQTKVRERFCPDKIAQDWLKVLHETQSL